MFGYVNACLESLTVEEKGRYESFYCGLCRELKTRWGALARFSLTYDMTFLAMLLGSLYEPEEKTGGSHCLLHPKKPRSFIQTKYTEYAADMSILLAHANCLDDWRDEKRISSGMYAKTLEGKVRSVMKRYPRQAKTLIREADRLAILETTKSKDIDGAASCAGAILGEIFTPQEDFWSGQLRDFGTQLGKFIYVMDAACDKKRDLESGSYNPFLVLEWDDESIQHALELFIANVTESFDKLPLERDLHLMKNILYSGVWQRFNRIYHSNHNE